MRQIVAPSPHIKKPGNRLSKLTVTRLTQGQKLRHTRSGISTGCSGLTAIKAMARPVGH